MIGVVAPGSQRSVVAEFFELFKTPWEWVQPGRSYDVMLCATDELPPNPAQLVLIFFARAHAMDAQLGVKSVPQPTSAVLRGKHGSVPLLGASMAFEGPPHLGLVEDSTGNSLAVQREGSSRTCVRVGYDFFDEVRQLLSSGQPLVHAGIPSLDLHICLLRDLMIGGGLPVIEIPPVPFGHPFAVCLTHDIDHPVFRNHCTDRTMIGFLYRSTLGSVWDLLRGRKSVSAVARNLLAVLRWPFVYLGLLPDPWREALVAYGKIERGLGSTFFAIPYGARPGSSLPGTTSGVSAPRARGAGYDLAEIEPELRALNREGAELGLHGIDAWSDQGAARDEAARVLRLTGESSLGVRMHWLYFDPERSPAVLDDAGFTYDSTCGFNEAVGFRAGTAQVFRPPGATRLLELPLHVMDTALFYPGRMHLDAEEAKRLVLLIIGHLAASGGVLTINWHDRSVAPERCWDEFYRWLLDELQRTGAWFATARQAVTWFQGRRAIRFNDVRRTEQEITIQTSLPEVETKSGYRLRVHRGRKAKEPEPAAADAFVDVALRTGEMSVAV